MVNVENLEHYTSLPVNIRIHGAADEDKAPWVKRTIKKISLCPEETHVRIYFDKHFYFAVPLTSTVVEKEKEWVAYDETAKLYYVIKSEVS